MTPPLLIAESITKRYDRHRVSAVAGVDLQVARGEFVSIVGPSGSGKSTLLHILGALERPDSGRVLLDGRDLTAERRLDRVRAQSIGFVFQLHNLVPTLTAAENVALPLYPLGVKARDRRQRAAAMLEAVGLPHRENHLPDELSGGERQRVAVARALINQPLLVLADEPTGDLDQQTGAQILQLLERMHVQRHLTLVLVTHDPHVAAAADRTLSMLDGKLTDVPGPSEP